MLKDKRLVVAIITIVLLIIKEILQLDIDMDSMIAAASVVVAFILGDSAIKCSENCNNTKKYPSDY